MTHGGTIKLPSRIPALDPATVKLKGFAKREAKLCTIGRAIYFVGRNSVPTAVFEIRRL